YYNGMVAVAKYQSRRGYFLQASYTLSKSMDYNSAYFGSTGELSSVADSRQIFLERGPSSFDTRQRIVVVHNVDLPIGPGHAFLGSSNMLNRQLASGWSLSGIVSAQTGQPFTVYNTSADFSGF